MANNFESNFTRKVMMKVIPAFETERVITKNVNTQLFSGAFDPNSGDTVDIKRPTRYNSIRTSTGDITGQKQDIITGKASATVQDYFTVAIDYDEAAEALEMGTDADRFWQDAMRDEVVDFELDFADFMLKNTGLYSGTYGSAITTWGDISKADALMKETGVPTGEWYAAVDPFATQQLADNQRSLGSGRDSLVDEAHEMATISRRFGGFDRVLTATSLASVTTATGADRAGTLSANPIVTYVNAKDTMTQQLAVTGFQANLDVKAGEVLEITGRNRLNLSTKNPALNAGANILFSGTVTQDVTLDGSGAGTITVTGPAIFEASGAYNTVDSAPISGDVVTLLGVGNSATYRPGMFWHRDSFSLTSIPIKRLHSTDTIFTTKDGLQFRVSKYSDGDANKQTVRIDFRPAYGVMNPFMAGQLFGNP